MGKLRYEENYNITPGMRDEFGYLKPHSILDLCQNVAGKHANNMGIGDEFCDKNNYGWIVARQMVKIIKHVKNVDEVKVITYPLHPNRFEYIRDYEIRNLEDELIISARSIWVLLDFSKRKMVLNEKIYPEGEYEENIFFIDKVLKPSIILDEEKKVATYEVKKSDIDKYHHMNNASYARLVFDYCPLNYSEVESFTINYQNEIKYDQVMNLNLSVTDNSYYLTGIKDDKVIFSSVMKIKEGEK